MSAWRPLEITLVNAVEVRLATFPSGFGRWFRDWSWVVVFPGVLRWRGNIWTRTAGTLAAVRTLDFWSFVFVALYVLSCCLSCLVLARVPPVARLFGRRRLCRIVRLVCVVSSNYLQFVLLGWLIFWVAISIPSTWFPPTHGVYILNFGGERNLLAMNSTLS